MEEHSKFFTMLTHTGPRDEEDCQLTNTFPRTSQKDLTGPQDPSLATPGYVYGVISPPTSSLPEEELSTDEAYAIAGNKVPEILIFSNGQLEGEVLSLSSADSDEPWMSHSSSKTWVSFERKMMDEWKALQPKLMRMYPTERSLDKVCPFVPREFSEFLQHEEEMRYATMEAIIRKGTAREQSEILGNPDKLIEKPFYGREFGTLEHGPDKPPLESNPNPPTRGYVLSERTIWCPFPTVPWRLPPPWPCRQEMDWEGDQRVATESGRFGRFPPLPRFDPQNESVPWHLRARLKPYPFDEVWQIPTMEDILLPVDEITDERVISQLLNQDLLDELDNPPIPPRPNLLR
jgi:hypothetical protein